MSIAKRISPIALVVNRGFTIVELLIVIVVIGILAGITIVAYNGIQNRAYDAAVQNDILAISKKAGAFYATEGHYPTSQTELATLGIEATKDAYDKSISYNLSFCYSNDDLGTTFAVHALSRSGAVFQFGRKGGQVAKYTGSTTYTGSTFTTFCNQTELGTNGSGGSGWAYPNWRTWVGGN